MRMFSLGLSHFGLDMHPDQLRRFPKTVVFDAGLNFNHTYLTGDPLVRNAVERAMKSGNLRLVNHALVENLARAHAGFLAILDEQGIPIAPTMVRLKSVNGGKPTLIGQPLPHESKLWVRKISRDETGKLFGHRGRGVGFLFPNLPQDVTPAHDGEFYQQFVIPKDGYLRDLRVYVAGDTLIPGYLLKATEPITGDNLSGRMLPNERQIVNASHPGEVIPLTGALAKRLVEQARKVREALLDGLMSRNPGLRREDLFNFGSIDFLIDEDGNLRASEFDVSPAISDSAGKKLGKALALHLARRAEKGHVVRVYGNPDEPFFAALLSNLKILLPSERVIHKPTLYRAAVQDYAANP